MSDTQNDAEKELAEYMEDMQLVAEQKEMLDLLKQPVDKEKEKAAIAAAMAAIAGGSIPTSAALTSASGKAESVPLPAAAAAAAAPAPAGPVHRFWDTQPVPKLGAEVSEHGPIDAPKTVAEVKADPYGLPEGFTWCTLDVRNPDRKDLTELYKLLSENYVEDDDAMFRFEYSAEFLLWALTPPDTFPEWIVGVRAKPTGKLVACITGVTAHMNVYERPVLLCEINFLCVHKKLRSKRLAPVLIKEVTRRVNLRDIWQATYTAGAVLPKPVASCQYWHRSLNSKKLIDIRFSSLPPRMTLARLQRLHALPEEPQIKGTRALAAADVPEACALLNAHLRTFSLAPVYSEAEFAHWFLPRAGVIESYVVANEDLPAGKQVTDFLSFFHLPSSVINHDRYKTMNAAYSYYNVPGAHSFASIMQESLILAKRSGIDVFNALDLMQNDPALLKDLKFGPGDGKLQYYLYNWACPEMPPSKVGLVLL